EICIEGLNLAEGYLNNPELTAEKFLKVSGDNFRLYKTGDLGYLLNDQIVFCGRSDTQVKFNGHRINLIEIEYSLESYELINEAVVQYYQTPEKKIVAYVTGDQAMSPSVIQEFLSSSLPHYMIPSEFNYLERMPAKANGKKDRTNLTNSNYVKLVEESYASPRSEFEMALVNVWSEILAKELVGVKDNFFRLGGDSIKAIQVVSRLHQMGFKLTIKDLLKNPVLENMAEHIGSFQNRISQDMVHGQFPLSPVQLYFFEHHKHHLNQYNQSFLIELKEERPDRSSLEDIISKIFQHHDMLRINFKMTEDGICQTCTDFMEPYHLEECDLENDPNPEESFRKKVNQIQSSFDVFKGPLVKFTLFLFPDSTKLLTVMHHLITDGVSWRIIFDDLESLLRQHKNGETYHLPLKTSSYKSWIERLMEWSKSKEMISDLSYWSNMPSVVDDKIRRDKTNEEDNLIKDERDLTFSLSAADTDLIVSKVNDTFKTTVNDVLLAALSKAFTTVFNLDNIVIGVEGHGREDMFDDIDITRTVGWFTSIYPVSMEHAHDLSLTDHIIAVKEIMHNVPNNGIGYGVFKYLRPNETDSPDQKPSVLFNYLGKIDNELESTDFNLAQDDIGQERDERMDRIYEFRINAIMVKNVLNVSIGYNRNHYHLFTIERLKETILDTLSEIIELSSSTTEEIVSPSDFTFKGLSKSDLQNLID
ncbi:MAG: condensation domain-containing protein, partial [Bacteroidota bacterium]